MAPYDATTNPEGGADWKYIAANIDDDAAGDAIDEVVDRRLRSGPGRLHRCSHRRTAQLGQPGRHLPDHRHRHCRRHERRSRRSRRQPGRRRSRVAGARRRSTTNLASATDNATSFGQIVNGVNANVDAIVSGHTHLAYNHAIPVPAWIADASHPVKNRPVVSAGQYGTNLNQLLFSVDEANGTVTGVTQNLVALKSPVVPATNPATFPANFPADADRRHRCCGGRECRRPRFGGTRQDRRADQPCEAGQRHHREPWRRVDHQQPGRRSSALGDRSTRNRRSPNRLHEPGRPPRRHAGYIPAATPPR